MRDRTLTLEPSQRRRLEDLLASPTIRPRVALRSRIVLLAADGLSNIEIAEKTGVSQPTVANWRERYLRFGIDGLFDRNRTGRPRVVDRGQVIAATLRPPPCEVGARVWSSRLLGAHLGVGDTTVARVWREYGISSVEPGLLGFATDPELRASTVDVRGVYLSSAFRAVVLTVGAEPGGEAVVGPLTYAHGLGRFVRDVVGDHADGTTHLVVDDVVQVDLPSEAELHLARPTRLWLNLLSVWCAQAGLRDGSDSLPAQMRDLTGAVRGSDRVLVWARAAPSPE